MKKLFIPLLVVLCILSCEKDESMDPLTVSILIEIDPDEEIIFVNKTKKLELDIDVTVTGDDNRFHYLIFESVNQSNLRKIDTLVNTPDGTVTPYRYSLEKLLEEDIINSEATVDIKVVHQTSTASGGNIFSLNFKSVLVKFRD